MKEACGLEFDFQLGDGTRPGTVFVNYVFGSEEYIEFVGSNFNDQFVFLLDGKNIATVAFDFFGDGSLFTQELVNINSISPNSNAHSLPQ